MRFLLSVRPALPVELGMRLNWYPELIGIARRKVSQDAV
jgi:hypothetical protein